jgi:N-acyl homoserine lactone hydrolase
LEIQLRNITRFFALSFVLAVLAACGSDGSAPQSTRIYIFDNGNIRGLSPALFNFTPEELAEVDFVNRSYLIVHPEGTVMFEAGAVLDSVFDEHEGPVTEGIMTATRPLLPQLAAIGYTPADIDYFVLSHYHSDHTANANAFSGATWIVQQALENADTVILENEDFDIFRDGGVVVMSTPGHTPGHQVMAVELENTGVVILGGDLYHYPEEITTGRVPTFEFDAVQSRASRAKVLASLEATGGTLWIEHDIATHAALPQAPEFVD